MCAAACLLEVRAVSVDHDAVGVPVDDFKPQLRLREVHGALQALSALSRDQRGDRLSVEPAGKSYQRKTKTTHKRQQ